MDFQNSASLTLNDFFGGELPSYVTAWLSGSENNQHLLTATISAIATGLCIRGRSGKIHWQADQWTRNDGSLVFGRWDIAGDAATEQGEVGRHMGSIHFTQHNTLSVEFSFKNLFSSGLRLEAPAADANFSLMKLAGFAPRNHATRRVELPAGGTASLTPKEHDIYIALLEQGFLPVPMLDNNRSFTRWQVDLGSVEGAARLQAAMQKLVDIYRSVPLFRFSQGNPPANYRKLGLVDLQVF